MTRQSLENPAFPPRTRSQPLRPAIRYRRAFRWTALGAWFLMMPPVPLGTALPPISAWTRVSEHKTAGECERSREAMRKSARRTVTADPGASALKVASALGQLEAKCVSDGKPPAAPPPEAPAVPAPPAAPAPKP